MGKTPKKRRMILLKKLARKARGRHDQKLALSEIAPLLNMIHLSTGTKFVDRENPVYEGGSDLAYDFSTLLEEGLIRLTYLDHEPDGIGGFVSKNPALTVSLDGFEAIAENSKSWLKKAIERQPMTFLQIIVTVVIALMTAIGGWAIGRYVTPVEHQKQISATQPAPIEQAATGIEK